MALLAVLAPALGALFIALTGERRANLREFWSVAAGVVLAAIVAGMIPEILAAFVLPNHPAVDRVLHSAAEFMAQLYERRGESLPKTIRRVQLDRINSLRDNKQADHPFTWGAFIALGDWR